MLAPDAPEHAVVTPVLLRLRSAIQEEPDRTPEEKEFVVSTQDIVERLREEGREEGRAQGLRDAIIEVHETRFGAIAPELATAIRVERDLEALHRLNRAAVTCSADEFASLLRAWRVS